MNDRRLDALLRTIHADPARAPQPDAVIRHVLSSPIERMPQRRRWLPRIDTGRSQTMFSAVKFLVAGLVVALFGGFLMTGMLTTQPTEESAPAVGASATPSPSPTPASTTESSETASDTRVAGDGPWLEWEPAPELEDELRESFGEVAAYDPGYRLEFRSGELIKRGKPPMPVGYRPVRVEATWPDGRVTASTIDRSLLIDSAAIGPAGIVFQAEPAVGAWDIYQLATDRRRPRGCCRLDDQGVVRVKAGEGLPRRIRPEDYEDRLRRVGLRAEDIVPHPENGPDAFKNQGWFSPDGESWARVDPWPFDGLQQLIATDDGFVARDGGHEIYASKDGVTWERVPLESATAPSFPVLVPWVDEVLVYHSEPSRLGRLGPSGVVELPFSPEVFGPEGVLATESIAPWSVAAGESGIVALDWASRSVVFSPDGERWSVSTMPEAWRDLGGYSSVHVLDGEIVVRGDSPEGATFRATQLARTSAPGDS